MLTVGDDGVGGASPSQGSGLSGLLDRVAAVSGTVTIASPLGEGTCIRAEIPLPPLGSREAVAAAHDAHG